MLGSQSATGCDECTLKTFGQCIQQNSKPELGTGRETHFTVSHEVALELRPEVTALFSHAL
jgi:hypothetical protein